MQKVYHLEFKATGFHFHYGDIAIMVSTWGKSLKVSIDTLYRWDFQNQYENEDIIIRKSELVKSTRTRK